MSTASTNYKNYTRSPDADIISLRDFMIDHGVEDSSAEAIARAIDAKFSNQDMSLFATKGDIKEVKSDIKELELKMNNMKLTIIIWVLGGTFAINQFPNLLNIFLKAIGK